jgi:hypothetical protein
VIAFFASVLSDTQARIDTWAGAHNPFYAGDYADLLSLIPFVGLTVLLYFVGRPARSSA